MEKCWLAIPEHFPHVELDAFVVMPNHIHGIVVITNPVGAQFIVVITNPVGAQFIAPNTQGAMNQGAMNQGAMNQGDEARPYGGAGGI
jgi:REP element-mobilizing transposase RayT